MAMDPKKRQKKMEKRSAKRKSKHHLLTKTKNAGMVQRLSAASHFPIIDCGTTENFWEEGLGQVWLSRQLPYGAIAFAVFLVDRYCLGVKDAFAQITSRFDYDEVLKKIQGGFQTQRLAPEAARKLVESAVVYAGDLGFAPHPDYHKAQAIFGDIDAGACADQFEFGQDGKPLFVAGPYDSQRRCEQILNTLRARCGPGGYHYTIPLSPSNLVNSEDLDDQDIELLDEDEEVDEELTPEPEPLRVYGEPRASEPREWQMKKAPVYQLKITLAHIKPPIWRRVETKDCSLARLHEIIQVSMGWYFSHLWSFNVGGVEYSENLADMDLEMEDAGRIKLSQVVQSGTKKIKYVYDFGDSWEHVIQVEKVKDADPRSHYPRCIEGNRACPPEDCGGAWGYESFLEAVQNPKHPEHDELLEWVGGEFDPEAFDLEAVNGALAVER